MWGSRPKRHVIRFKLGFHGLFGAIIIEPLHAKYHEGLCHVTSSYKEQAVIDAPGEEKFRELVLFAHNGIRFLDRHGHLIKTTEQGKQDEHGAPDHEDTGEKGYNYRSERFFNRLEQGHDISKVFDSKLHGDPATPVFCAYTGEHVMIRLLMPGDKPRNIGFLLHGHEWKAQPDDPYTRIIPMQEAISVGGSYDIELEGGANRIPGDYLYRSGSLRWDVESGMWGILRIKDRPAPYCDCCCCHCCPDPCSQKISCAAGEWWNRKGWDKYCRDSAWWTE